MSDLSRSLVDAAAEALCVDHGHSRQSGGMNCRTCARRARASVAAVLETLADDKSAKAAKCRLRPAETCRRCHQLLVHARGLRRLAAEVKKEKSDGQ